MNKRNYQKELEQLLANNKEKKPTLLLHACCAPCSSYVLEYLSNYFSITVFFFNPNISPSEEYEKRVLEIKRLIQELPTPTSVSFLEGRYDPSDFYQAVKGLEQIPEGGERCHACFRLRLMESARIAAMQNFDYFTTTLTISPLKNAQKLNEIGEEMAKQFRISWLPSDFKKKNGYKRSIELSAIYNLYRQDYCGCIFSKKERELQKQKSAL